VDFSKRISNAAFKCGLKRTDGNGHTRLHYVATFSRRSLGANAPDYGAYDKTVLYTRHWRPFAAKLTATGHHALVEEVL
jgi:hypothetical protein